MRTQYVIFDNNCYSMRALHAVFSFAETAKQCGYADIKVIIPPILLSEINRGMIVRELHRSKPEQNGHTDTTKDGNQADANGHAENGSTPGYSGHYGTNGVQYGYSYADTRGGSYGLPANGQTNGHANGKAKSSRPKHENIYEDLTLREILEAYSDYVVYPPLSHTEERISDLMYDYLVDMHTRRPGHFYRQTGIIDGSITKPQEQLGEYLRDPAFFCQMFNVCTRNGNFRNQLTANGLDKDPADTAMVAWFAQNCETQPESDTILISADQKLIDQMTAIHNFQFSPKRPERDTLTHFEYFDLPSLGTHLKEEIRLLGDFARTNGEMNDTLRMHINSTQEMAHVLSIRNRSNNRFINDSAVSSRLK